MEIKTRNKLEYLEQTKQMIREAIEAKGQTVSDSDSFRSYADKILEISGGGSGGGSDDIIIENVTWVDSTVSNQPSFGLVANGIIRYVTFMNEDGTVEYGRKSVISGENCVDPVANGLMDAPTKESTDQYNFTFSGGWATTPGGGKDSNALKNVTEDRTVYANFISTVRYYTITYYDSDGTTVLKTESLAYGSMPSYKPVKEGVTFTMWNPNTAVTGDMSYTAVWEEKITFANASWAKIAEIADSGNASDVFAVGDTKTITLTYPSGTTENGTLEIIGFNHDDLSDGSGKAGITISLVKTMRSYGAKEFSSSSSNVNYGKSNLKAVYDSVPSFLPEDVQAVVKTVTKKYSNEYGTGAVSYTCKAFPLSLREMGFSYSGMGFVNDEGNVYEKYSDNTSKNKNTSYAILKKDVNWYTRNRANTAMAYYIDTAGKVATQSQKYTAYLSFCFCV